MSRTVPRLRNEYQWRSSDVWTDTRLVFPDSLHSEIAEAKDRAILAVPLMTDGVVVGVASVRDLTGRDFVNQELQLTAAVAARAAQAVRCDE